MSPMAGLEADQVSALEIRLALPLARLKSRKAEQVGVSTSPGTLQSTGGFVERVRHRWEEARVGNIGFEPFRMLYPPSQMWYTLPV